MTKLKLTARLVVRGADKALKFYKDVFGAKLLERYADDTGHVVHAAFQIDDVVISLTEEKKDWQNLSPESLGGSPVLLNLVVDDADALGAKMEAAGAKVVVPIADQFYGHREGRLRDPFGHLWIVTKIVETLSAEEIEKRMQ